MKIENWKLKIGNKPGFSMAEVMISASVLIIMIAGIFLALTNSLNHSMDSRNHIIASELAQEGIELIRNVRDNNLASGENYDIYFFYSSEDICRVDGTYVYGSEIYCNCNIYDSDDLRLKYNTGTYFYEHSAGTDTKFFRRIKIADYSGIGRKITSIVSWNGSAPDANITNCNVGTKCVYAEAVLTDR